MKKETPDHLDNKDPLDQFLLETDGYILDNGFTAQVMTSLPARRKHSWRRFVVLSAAMFIGSILVIWQLPSATTIISSMPRQWSAFDWPMLVVLVPLLAALASIGWAIFAITTEE